MGSIFDSLVDLTLGIVAPVAPLVQPTFASDRSPVLPIELEVVQDSPLRRAVHVPNGHRAPEPTRPISIVTRDIAPAHEKDGIAQSPATATRAILRSAMQPLVPLLDPTPSLGPPPVQARTTALTAAPSDHVGGRAALSVSVGGSTLLIATGDDATAEPPAAPASPRRTSYAPRSSASLRSGDEPHAQEGVAAESVVRVTIGRVDVRAIHAREPAPRPSPTASRSSTALADYLRDRSKRGPR